MHDEVTLVGDMIKLLSRDKLVDAQHRNALDRIYWVTAVSKINWLPLDTEFHVFRFSDKLWVLPWDTAGVHAAINAIWPEQEERSARSWIAAISEIPRDWRKSYLFDLFRPRAPTLLVLPLTGLPPWLIKRDESQADYVQEHEYPYLANLVCCWFHQDYDIAGSTLEAVIASFKKDSNPDTWAETRGDIARLLNRFDDQALPQEFVDLFTPDVTVEGWDGMSTLQWLTRVNALLR
jgi:CdiI immunity protein